MLLLTILDAKTVRLPDGTTVRDRTPVLEACRRLIAAGTDPKTRFEAWWHGAEHAALLGTVGGAAKLDVREEDRGGLRFRQYDPRPSRNMPRAVGGEAQNGWSKGMPATPLAAKP